LTVSLVTYTEKNKAKVCNGFNLHWFWHVKDKRAMKFT
jgi:phage anti-repressor protein